ncbi:MAG: hypothetical protein K6A39_01100 [Clostridiales bacterium]|nr:hypothetical protein [Clostridiales bacterium]
MKTDNTIPLIIGVTGHRALRENDRAPLLNAVKTELEALMKRYPNTPFKMMNSLAEGADLLCAEAAESLGIPLIVPLPTELPVYEQDFSPEARAALHRYCDMAEQVFIVPAAESVSETMPFRNFLFRQAGIYMTSHCHVLLALWDGKDGFSGCGTAEAVSFALSGDYRPDIGLPPRSEMNELVVHIMTPREETSSDTAGTVRYLGNEEAVRKILSDTDSFNGRAASIPVSDRLLLPEDLPLDPCVRRMEHVYQAASVICGNAAKQYRRTLALLAVIGSVLTMAFLLYDEAQLIWMILICGAMLLAAWLCQRYAVRSACQRLYLECRALAESIRVQLFLRYAGSDRNVPDLLSWSQREETPWILTSLSALHIGPAPETQHPVRDCWPEDQKAYHLRAGIKASASLTVSERTVRTALLISVVMYLLAVLFELLSGGKLLKPRFPVADPEIWRTVLKIVMGSISAITLFIANYFGKQSLQRKASDHSKMAQFYSVISERLSLCGQTDELLTALAREELIENGNWVSYERDNTPDISF